MTNINTLGVLLLKTVGSCVAHLYEYVSRYLDDDGECSQILVLIETSPGNRIARWVKVNGNNHAWSPESEKYICASQSTLPFKT